MTLPTVTEVILALGAVLLLARDLHRAWFDRLRRPITLLVAALVAALLIGAAGGRPHPSPWWLLLPGSVLAWEVARGWRRAPRSHLWEAGLGAFAASLLFGAIGLGATSESMAAALIAIGAVAAGVGGGLLWRSRQREPHPWRAGDRSRYERRVAQREGA